MKIKTPIIALSIAVLAACGSNGEIEASVPDDQVIQPRSGESHWDVTDVLGVTMSVPASFEKSGPISPGGDGEVYTFQTPENSIGTRGGVQLTTLPQRRMPAEELSDSIINQAKATTGATDAKKVQVTWPGATDAWFITYVAQVPSAGTTAPHPAEVLIVDLPNGGQAQVIVSTIEEEFESLRMHEILETLTITASAGQGS